MNILIIFLLGIGFSLIVIPIIQSFTDIIYLFSELIKAKISVAITKYNVQITELSNPAEEVRTNAVGFSIPDESDEELYDDDEEENKDKKTNKFQNFNRKIGF